jgi:predicted ester cyclase
LPIHLLAVSSESGTVDAAAVYRRFVEGLNRRDLEAVESTVDPERWREVCVGYTQGVIEWPESRGSIERVWQGIPDLRFEPEHVVTDGSQVVAVGTARGRQSGRLFGAPATRREYAVSMFDYVRVEDGRIVDRIQQADMLGQMRQLFGPLLVVVLVVAAVLLLALGVLIGALAL